MCTFVCRISAIRSAYLAILNQAGSNRRDVVWWTHMILLNLVEECPIAHFQQAGCRLAVPLGLLKRGCDGISLGFPFHALQKRFETRGRTFIGRSFCTWSSVSSQLPQILCRGTVLLWSARRDAILSHEQMTLHKLLQFAEITRPIITLAGSQHTRREHARRKPIPPCQLVHKVSKQQRNFFFALAQRRHVDRKRAQPIIEIFPQLALRHRLFQIAAGGS